MLLQARSGSGGGSVGAVAAADAADAAGATAAAAVAAALAPTSPSSANSSRRTCWPRKIACARMRHIAHHSNAAVDGDTLECGVWADGPVDVRGQRDG